MKPLYLLISLLQFCFLVACSGSDSTMNSTKVYDAFENATKKPAAKIFHEDNWTIVSTKEDGNRVYWFMAPDVDNVSPAVFKKTVHADDKSKLETKIVSQCEAPKQTCDDLKKQFKTLSEKYK